MQIEVQTSTGVVLMNRAFSTNPDSTRAVLSALSGRVKALATEARGFWFWFSDLCREYRMSSGSTKAPSLAARVPSFCVVEARHRSEQRGRDRPMDSWVVDDEPGREVTFLLSDPEDGTSRRCCRPSDPPRVRASRDRACNPPTARARFTRGDMAAISHTP